jgi:hypothetical protein
MTSTIALETHSIHMDLQECLTYWCVSKKTYGTKQRNRGPWAMDSSNKLTYPHDQADVNDGHYDIKKGACGGVVHAAGEGLERVVDRLHDLLPTSLWWFTCL